MIAEGINRELTSDEYHGLAGTYSSSQLKDILEDVELFHKKYITKEITKERMSAFDVGTYFHTGVLEPHKLEEECVIFDGVRRGKAWEEFSEANKNKAILTPNEKATGEALIKAVQSSPIAMNRIKRGEPEVSAFLDLLVDGSMIYSPTYKVELAAHGWVTAKNKPAKDATPLRLKVRADLLADHFILDLKSTTGNAKNVGLMRSKISQYNYDLSAALYLDIFSLVSGIVKTEFLWTFGSKDYFNSRTYIASDKNIRIGRAKWRKAAMTLAECIQNNWVFEDSMGILEPMHFEEEWIKEKAEDLL